MCDTASSRILSRFGEGSPLAAASWACLLRSPPPPPPPPPPCAPSPSPPPPPCESSFLYHTLNPGIMIQDCAPEAATVVASTAHCACNPVLSWPSQIPTTTSTLFPVVVQLLPCLAVVPRVLRVSEAVAVFEARVCFPFRPHIPCQFVEMYHTEKKRHLILRACVRNKKALTCSRSWRSSKVSESFSKETAYSKPSSR